MREPKTLVLIECRACNGSYYGGEDKLVLYPGTENELPSEIYFTIRKISKCNLCKTREDRTRGGNKRKFNI